jgi:opacity protein-like surface antigen
VTRGHLQVVTVVLTVACSAAAATAQEEQVPAGQAAPSQVRVVRDKTTIWSRSPSLVLAIVKAGTVMQAVAREDRWIVVIVPASEGGKGNRGFVLAAHVEHVAGTPEIPVRQPDTLTPSEAAARPAVSPPAIGIRGFGVASYSLFQARDSFEAVLGSAWQPFFGGGGQVVIHDRFFVDASFEQFKKTGQRVIVSNGEVFPLGIDDEVTVNPFTVSGGYRFRTNRSMVSYVGGGIGTYRYRETSDFADPSENVDERHTGYHALGGVEYGFARWTFVAFEVRYASVPDALGPPGVSREFDETNLGGFSLGLRVLVGR